MDTWGGMGMWLEEEDWAEGGIYSNDQCSCHRGSANPRGSRGSPSELCCLEGGGGAFKPCTDLLLGRGRCQGCDCRRGIT